MKVTTHFSSEEFDRPARVRAGKQFPTAAYPAKWIESRLRPLCETLEVIRSALSAPLKIGSGYRDPAYNVAIGGARASQHMEGRAADITVRGWSAANVHATILALYAQGKLPHLGGLGIYPGFVHVDVRPTKKLMRWTGSRDAN
jgi:uncharacterized protein YcbK (DUF882 family)